MGFWHNAISEIRANLAEDSQHLKLNLSWLFNRTLTTDILTVSLTKKCNLNCTYCWDHDQRERLDELKTDEIKKLLLSAKKLGVRSFNPFGGEPFIRSDAIEIIRYAFEIGFKLVTVTTNGTLLTEERIFDVVRAVPTSARLGVLISLDGTSAQENDFIRSTGSFSKTTASIQRFRKARDETRRDIGIIVNTVVSRNNFRSMRKQIDLSLDLGADCVHFITPIVNGGVVAKDMVSRDLFLRPEDFEELDRAIDEVIDLSRAKHCVLNNEESLRNFKDFYRRQYAQHQHLIAAASNS